MNEFGLDGEQPTGQVAEVSGRLVEFVGTSLGTSEGSLFIWDFGDEIGSSTENPNLVKTKDVITPVTNYYSFVGKYVVRLIEQRKDGLAYIDDFESYDDTGNRVQILFAEQGIAERGLE